jgi:hypothetical protein
LYDPVESVILLIRGAKIVLNRANKQKEAERNAD